MTDSTSSNDGPNLAPLTLEGHYVLHQLFRMTPVEADEEETLRRREAASALAQLIASWEDLGDEGWSGLYRIVGGGTDYLLMHFRPTLDALGDTEAAIRRSPISRYLEPTGDYLSVVELSLYHATAGLLQEARERGIVPASEGWQEMVEARRAQEGGSKYAMQRLRPTQPDEMPYICFYPMDKRRRPGQNWYALPVEERARMIQEHGMTGRRYAGRVSQVISGSIGLDDWEWAVTLFAGDPLDFKALITEMRYDQVSVEYAEFGSFWVGHRIPTHKILAELLA